MQSALNGFVQLEDQGSYNVCEVCKYIGPRRRCRTPDMTLFQYWPMWLVGEYGIREVLLCNDCFNSASDTLPPNSPMPTVLSSIDNDIMFSIEDMFHFEEDHDNMLDIIPDPSVAIATLTTLTYILMPEK